MILSMLHKLFKHDPTKVDREVSHVRNLLISELDRIEALTIQSRVMGRNYNAGNINNRDRGTDMDCPRCNRAGDP